MDSEDWIKRRSWDLPASLGDFLALVGGTPDGVLNFFKLDAALPMPDNLLIDVVEWMDSRGFRANLPLWVRAKYRALLSG